jgi:hypothetical protein
MALRNVIGAKIRVFQQYASKTLIHRAGAKRLILSTGASFRLNGIARRSADDGAFIF